MHHQRAFSSEVGTGSREENASNKDSDATRSGKKAAGNRRPDLSGKVAIAYSAATFRGGSSAPESWISAT